MNTIERYAKGKKFLLLLAVNLFVIFVVLVVIEIASYFFMKHATVQMSQGMTSGEFALSNPVAFAGTDDFEEVVKGMSGNTNCPTNRIIFDSISGFPRFEIDDIECDGPENIVKGLRKTTNQEEHPKNHIYMFGGSAMWGTGSADRNTIASLLQSYLIANNKRYAVFNYGFSTVVAHQELSRLKTLHLDNGDVVIFYDGANDIWQGVVYGRPSGTIIGYNEANSLRVLLNKIKFFLFSNSNFYSVLGWLKNKKPSDMYSECQKLDSAEIISRAERGFDIYRTSLMEAREYAELKGAYFFHFFQPMAISKRPFSPYIQGLLDHMSLEIKCGLSIAEKGFQYYKDRYRDIQREMNAFDISDVLDSVSSGREYFFDLNHVSSSGNKKVADEIYARISRLLN